MNVPITPGTHLVEASAGTGKTWNIAQMFLRLVLEAELGVDQILVVTFTDAATAELRDRIRRRLREAVAAWEGWVTSGRLPDDPTLAALLTERSAHASAGRPDLARLDAALQRFDEAAVSTIHGFCYRMLTRYAFESGTPFQLSLADDGGPLLEDLVRDVWARWAYAMPPLVVRHVRASGRDPDRLLGLARAVARDPAVRVVPPPPDLPASKADEGAVARWRVAYDALCEAFTSSGGGFFGAVRALTRGERASLHYPDVLRWTVEVRDFCSGDAHPGSALPDGARQVAASKLAERSAPQRLCDHPVARALDALVAAADALAPGLDTWVLALDHEVVRAVRERLPDLRAARRAVAFDDLLREVHAALADATRGPELVRVLQGRFRAALIDEFQDTDPLQYAIFRTLFHGAAVEPRWLYLIGDPKQAIYRFRGADVFTYLEARRDADEASTLTENHRSDRSMVDAVHHLFGRVPGVFLVEGIHVPRVRAVHGDRLVVGGEAPLDDLPRPAMQIRLIERTPEACRKDGLFRMDWLRREVPRVVAADVAAFLASAPRVREGAAEVPLGPRDLAVLTRTNQQAWSVQDALRQVGVPSVLTSAVSVFGTEEARDLELILRALREPSRPRAVRTALVTPPFGFTAVEVAALDLDERAWEREVARFRTWGAIWRDRGLMQAFRVLLHEVDGAARLLGWVDGERRLTNTLHLVELLHRYAREAAMGPARVCRFLATERRQERSPSEARQLRLESDDAAVRLVTVHSSKGLEYPVVWCPFLWHATDNPANRPTFVDAHGADGVRRIDLGSDEQEALRSRHEEEGLSEDLRLAYVALTRARHRCVVFLAAGPGLERTSLGILLHPDAAAGARGLSFLGSFGDDTILSGLEGLAAGSGGVVAAGRVSAPGPRSSRSDVVAPAAPGGPVAWCATARAVGSDGWCRESFSSLVGGHAADGPELGDPSASAPPRVAPASEAPIPLADFPGGTRSGLFVHGLLEALDLGAPDRVAWGAATEAALTSHHLPVRWAAAVTDTLLSTVEVPLGGGAPRLRDVPAADRAAEVSFQIPVRAPGALAVPALVGLLRTFGMEGMPPTYPDVLERRARLSQEVAPRAGHGLLVGSIDLVLRAAGRWWFVDWKSNHLGRSVGDYDADRLPEAMIDHDYPVQVLLYALAVHRWLQRVPGYHYDTHVGGARYLFLRGVGVGPPTDPPRGVWAGRPSWALVQALERRLG